MSDDPVKANIISEPMVRIGDEEPRFLHALAKCFVVDDHHIELHVNGELPITPRVMLNLCKSYAASLDRVTDLEPCVERMVNDNVGKSHKEWRNPAQKYRDYLAELLFIEGVESVICNQRYSIHVEVGHFYDLAVVGEAVARCVHRHLFPERRLSLCTETIPVIHKNSPSTAEREGGTNNASGARSRHCPDRYHLSDEDDTDRDGGGVCDNAKDES